MTQINVPALEQGVTRVFALSLTSREARQLRDTELMQKAALGVDHLVPSGVEIFALDDLGEMGLVGYLREGVDAQEEALTRDRAKLSALQGWVMILHSSAFEGAAVTLELGRAITLIGTYGQTEPDTPPVAVQAESAAPYSGTPSNKETNNRHQRQNGFLMPGLLFVAVLATLLWVLN